VATLLKILVTLLKCIIFYPMLWFRVVIRLIFGLLAYGCLFAGIILFFASMLGKLPGPNSWVSWVFTLGASFISFMILTLYDAILLRLNPINDILILS
jgi:hypothetical protein